MGIMTSEDWQMIENSKIGDYNTLSFFKMEKVTISGCTLNVDKFSGITVNTCDFFNLEAKGIVDGGLQIKFDKRLPDLTEMDCKEWRYNKEDKTLHITWGNYGNIMEDFKIVEDNLVFYLGDFGALPDYKNALESLMKRIGEYFVRI